MLTLFPPDTHHLRAAEGWLELGNYLEANVELDHITAPNRDLPEVLNVRYGVLAAAKDWPAAADVAQAVTLLTPEEPQGWLNFSFALHEMKRTTEARDNLAAVIDQFSRTAVMHYNLACYECQLGNLEKAREYLTRCFRLRAGKALKEDAATDPDLQPLWGDLHL